MGLFSPDPSAAPYRRDSLSQRGGGRRSDAQSRRRTRSSRCAHVAVEGYLRFPLLNESDREAFRLRFPFTQGLSNEAPALPFGWPASRKLASISSVPRSRSWNSTVSLEVFQMLRSFQGSQSTHPHLGPLRARSIPWPTHGCSRQRIDGKEKEELLSWRGPRMHTA